MAGGSSVGGSAGAGGTGVGGSVSSSTGTSVGSVGGSTDSVGTGGTGRGRVRTVQSRYLSQPGRKTAPAAAAPNVTAPARAKALRPTAAPATNKPPTAAVRPPTVPLATKPPVDVTHTSSDDIDALQARLLQLKYLNLRSKQAHADRIRTLQDQCTRVWLHAETLADTTATKHTQALLDGYSEHLDVFLRQAQNHTDAMVETFPRFKDAFHTLLRAIRQAINLLPVDGLAFDNNAVGDDLLRSLNQCCLNLDSMHDIIANIDKFRDLKSSLDSLLAVLNEQIELGSQSNERLFERLDQLTHARLNTLAHHVGH